MSNLKSDLIFAKTSGLDIITLFNEEYAGVSGFKWKMGIQLPADIAALLTPS